jgi:hypothetical protein
VDTDIRSLLVTIGTSSSVGNGTVTGSGNSGSLFGKFILVIDQFFLFGSHFEGYVAVGWLGLLCISAVEEEQSAGKMVAVA